MFLVMLSACSASIDEEKKVAQEAVKNVFTSELDVETNKEMKGYHFYLPKGMVMKESIDNNIVLARGKNIYILFINPQEQSSSEVVYQSSVSPKITYVMDETFTTKGEFGYLLIHEINSEKDVYELTVGIGGVKLTTETNTKHLADNAKEMMEIVKSVENKNLIK